MQLHLGYELIYQMPHTTPMILVVNVHESRSQDMITTDRLLVEPAIPVRGVLKDGCSDSASRKFL
jgi:hypothetical protein